tara:strand:- start:113 stop:325 length:213 start_codon:yes stop_codon:yes gene_type:complete
MKWQNIQGESGYVRDEETGAILNVNKQEISQAKQAKLNRLKQKDELNNLRRDVDEMKGMLGKILDKLDGS